MYPSHPVSVSTHPGTEELIAPSMASLSIHAVLELQSLSLLVVVTLGTMGTALLLGLALAAFIQRRSQSYLLLVGAFGALFARSLVAGSTMVGVLSSTTHHFIEHGLDVVLVALVVAAVYHARTVTEETNLP
jgi:hypothetical protein